MRSTARVTSVPAWAAQPGRTEADKNASQERAAATIKMKGDLDTAAQQAEPFVTQTDPSIQQATKAYDDALAALKATISDREKNEAAPKTARGRVAARAL